MFEKSTLTHLLGVLLISGLVLIVDANSDLDALCNNKPVELRKISQVQSLIQQAKQDSAGACAKHAASLADLDDILSFVQTGKTCDLELVDKIRQFQQKYLVEGGDHELAPLALRQFFLALGFQISAECKIVMINNFETDVPSRFRKTEYEIFNVLKQGRLNPISEVADYDDIILPSKKLSARNSGVEVMSLLKGLLENDVVQDLVGKCNGKFKPIYDKLIMPVVELSNLGFDYKGEMLERELLEFRHNKLIHLWYYILQTCEAFVSVDVKSGKITEPSIPYETPISHNSDILWILDQPELQKLLSKYNSKATEADRERTKFIKKLLTGVKNAYF